MHTIQYNTTTVLNVGSNAGFVIARTELEIDEKELKQVGLRMTAKEVRER